MLHFDNPRQMPDTEPHPIVIIEKYPERKVSLGMKIFIFIFIVAIVGLFYLIVWSGGAILGV
jgi:hypothetical protein